MQPWSGFAIVFPETVGRIYNTIFITLYVTRTTSPDDKRAFGSRLTVFPQPGLKRNQAVVFDDITLSLPPPITGPDDQIAPHLRMRPRDRAIELSKRRDRGIPEILATVLIRFQRQYWEGDSTTSKSDNVCTRHVSPFFPS